MHAAFWLDQAANIILCREDIGRHNALDKLIGAATKAKVIDAEGALLITSRCSAELVQKAIASNIFTLVSLASPSSLAVEMALQYELTLIHLRREDPPIIYSQSAKLGNACHD